MPKAVIFDMGGTLEDVIHKEEYNQSCGELILAYLEKQDLAVEEDPIEFMEYVERRNKEYRHWSIQQGVELTPYEIWSEWYLDKYNLDDKRLRVVADKIADIWERNYYKRTLRPEARPMLDKLAEQGYRLGIISNTGSFSQVIEILHEYGIHHHFDCIYLSSISGTRKPAPELFWAASADLDVKPEESIYVGDTITRDVYGARNAKYLASIRIDSHLSGRSDERYVKEPDEADYLIENLMEIVDIVDELKKKSGREDL